MLRAALLPILLSLLRAPAALAVPAGSTILVDRPSGFAPLPFDGLTTWRSAASEPARSGERAPRRFTHTPTRR